MNDIGIYIHIPFCKSKCYYCDFNSYANFDIYIEKYIECLKLELLENFEILSNKTVASIYFGGGTPSYIDEKHIKQIISLIKSISIIDDEAEITIETNPGTVNKTKLEVYKEIGINRLSIGLQSTNDKILKSIGRIHSFEDFNEEYNIARDIGFNNISVDLMFGLPSQTIENVNEDLMRILSMNPEHVSIYSLSVEEDTKLETLISTGFLKLPDEDAERDMYNLIKSKLEKKGYNHYEISNFALKGHESRHNSNYWRQKEYIGLGAGAHSFVNNTRYGNEKDICKYIENVSSGNIQNIIIEKDMLSGADLAREYVILNLRFIKGLEIEKFNKKFNVKFEELFKMQVLKLIKEKLLTYSDDNKYIHLTERGQDIANEVWQEFI